MKEENIKNNEQVVEETIKTTVSKNKDGYGYKYTDLAQIHEYLEANNMRYYQYTDKIGDDDYIMTVPIINGEEKPARRGVKIVDAVLNGIKNPAQEQGSATTYARRYSLLMAFGLATDDDDAASLTKKVITTPEEARKYEITFGKHNGKTLGELFDEKQTKYIDWLFNNTKDETLRECISLIDGRKILTEEEQEEMLNLIGKMSDLIIETDTDYEKLLKHYEVSSNSEMTLEQLRDCVKLLEKKVN